MNIPSIIEITIKVMVPNPVRKKLINIGLASCSVFLNKTLEATNVSTADIAINSPNIIIVH